MDSTEPQPRIALDKLIAGVALITVGVAGFLGAMDILHFRDIGRLWPLILIVIGLGSEIESLRRRREGSGWILIAIGTWFLIGNFHLFGLSFRHALPVAIAIAGAGIVTHAIVDKPGSAKKEESNESQ